MVGSVELTIGQVAAYAGIRTSKIRYYESVGLVSVAPRVGGRRVYGTDVLDALRLIQFAQDAGFTIGEIRQILGGFDRKTPVSALWQNLAQRKLRDVGMVIERAQRMERVLRRLLTCECIRLSECVSHCGPPSPLNRSLRKRPQ